MGSSISIKGISVLALLLPVWDLLLRLISLSLIENEPYQITFYLAFIMIRVSLRFLEVIIAID